MRARSADHRFAVLRTTFSTGVGQVVHVSDITGLLELQDPGTGEVVFSCRPSLTGESLLKTATRSAMKLRH